MSPSRFIAYVALPGALRWRKIEHPATGEAPVAVYERAMNLALYLMRAGPLIRDGDTVGTTPTQRIAVARGEQGGVPTYRLEFVGNAAWPG